MTPANVSRRRSHSGRASSSMSSPRDLTTRFGNYKRLLLYAAFCIAIATTAGVTYYHSLTVQTLEHSHQLITLSSNRRQSYQAQDDERNHDRQPGDLTAVQLRGNSTLSNSPATNKIVSSSSNGLVAVAAAASWPAPQPATAPASVEVPCQLISSKGMTWALPAYVDPKQYSWQTTGAKEKLRRKVAGHVSSDAYKARVQQLVEQGGRGILINAGGAKFVTNLIVTLHVLRRHYNCTLPVEVAWQGKAEMDNVTWAALQQEFAPLRGLDVQAVPHPVAALNNPKVERSRYTGKVYSLLLSHFREVLMLDADSMFLQHPNNYFNHPLYNATGNMFWPDAWTDKVQSFAYEMFGLNANVAKSVLNQGKGDSRRDTESGQIVIDRSRHLDALEYTFWINSYRGEMEQVLWGDKDTFGLGFAVAGKAHLFTQVSVPPGGVFSWHKDMLLIKETQEKTWGWQLLGFLQYDSWGRPAFLHRTINKYRLDEEPWRLELISAPMPTRWVNFYLAHDNVGPTQGVPWDYVVPRSSFTILSVQPTLPQAGTGQDSKGAGQMDKQPANKGGLSKQEVGDSSGQSAGPDQTPGAAAATDVMASACPVPTFVTYWQARAASLPVDVDVALERACRPVLRALLGEQAWAEHEKRGYLEAPQLPYLDKAHLFDQPVSDYAAVYDDTPIAAWIPDYERPRVPNGDFTAPVRAAYEAFNWLRERTSQFPIVQGKPG